LALQGQVVRVQLSELVHRQIRPLQQP